MHTNSSYALASFLALSLFLLPAAHAEDGASDQRVSLPEGPGSLEGVGENVSINTQMGQMSYSVAMPLPEGFPDMTPSLALSYSSGGGTSIAGFGWNLSSPSIERMTAYGLPRYTTEDRFAAGGGAQLIRVSEGETSVYRARFEGDFIRYQWIQHGEGAEGHWISESPDGQISYFGATSDGTPVETARVGGENGTFRYLLTETVDRWGHKIRYQYRRTGSTSMLTGIGYVFDEADNPRFSVELDYEDRPDHISNATGGFQEVMEDRLSGARIYSGTTLLQRWAFTYEPAETSGGLSRLSRVERFGHEGGQYPVVFDFTYSRSFGGLCTDDTCARPYLTDMGGLGLNFQNGNTTLLDINGDALPDILHTPNTGKHRFFLNTYRSSQDHTFTSAPLSNIGEASTHVLSAGSVQVLDANGDGFADLLNTRTGQVLENGGIGDWTRLYSLFDEEDGGTPNLDGDLDPEDGDLNSIRFFDYDNDKKIDILKSEGSGPLNITQIYRNTGHGFAIQEGVAPLEVGFESDRLQLSDMNGDGLLDAVRLQAGQLAYRLNLGLGQWQDWTTIEDLPFTEDEIHLVELEDLNNDGLSDLVLVKSTNLVYALNRNGTSFRAPVTVDAESLGQPLPTRVAETTILYADMNGNGSEDIVWIDPNGQVNYLELFAVQPNLLSKITNNLGMVQEITYNTSVDEAAQATAEGNPWTRMLPYPTRVVTSVETYDTLTNVRLTTNYRYKDGYYDGVEKQFRGFAMVETESPGDESNETGASQLHYDVGAEDPYRAGLLLHQTFVSDQRTLREASFTYEDCPLAQIPNNLPIPVRYLCQTRATSVLMEGTVESEWVQSEVTRNYDNYGNIHLEAHHGTTSIGGQGCEPCTQDPSIFGKACGEQCLGDESYTETTYANPEDNEDRWILNAMIRERRYGRPGSSNTTDKRIYYDGPAFEGLPFGQITHGTQTRVTNQINAQGDTVETVRIRQDEHGNMVEEISPVGDPSITEEHRTRQYYDALGLRVIGVEMAMTDADGNPYLLRQEATYDDLWLRVASASDWFAVRNDEILTSLNTESVVYDEFGRLAARYYPGDPADQPSERYIYDLGDPVSRVTIEIRSEAGGEFDLSTVRCFDGSGRLYQERQRIDDENYLVNGYKTFNKDGKTRRAYDKYTALGNACDTQPPVGVPYQVITYDSTGRPTSDTWNFNGEQWMRRTEYGPSYSLNYDYNDTDPEHPYYDTPTRHEFNGLGQNTSLTRLTSPTQGETYHFTYDERGNLRGYIDPHGNEKIQTRDLADRLVSIDDPDRGTILYEHDAAGQIIREMDDRGIVMEYTHDGMGRLRTSIEASNPLDTLITYRYDLPGSCPSELCTFPAGRLVEVEYPTEGETSTDWYGYNDGGKSTFQRRNVLGRSFDFRWTYDNSDRMTSRIYPDGQILQLTTDDASRFTGIPGILNQIHYNSLSKIQSIELGNGTTETLEYDNIFRVAQREIDNADGNAIISYRYNYDRGGNLLTLLDSAVDPNKASATATFSYDAFDRLTTANMDPGRAEFEETMSYSYNAIGNLMSKTSSRGTESKNHVGHYTYGNNAGPHAVTQAGTKSYAYDATGQMTRKDNIDLTWDHEGRITAAHKDDQELIRNVYGAGSQRLLKITPESTTWYLADDFEIRDGVSSLYVEADQRSLARIDSPDAGPLVLSDLAPLRAPDQIINAADALLSLKISEGSTTPDETPARIDTVNDLLNAAVARLLTPEKRTTYTHEDHRNTTIATTNDTGELLERMVYYPNGMVRSTEEIQTSHRLYNGREKDDATGLIVFEARQLDPWLGRWASPDPLFVETEKAGFQYLEEETSAYAAMNNNPVRYHDPDGRAIAEILELTIRGIGAATAAVVGAVDWVHDTKREGQITGYRASKLKLFGAGAMGALTGAAYGFVAPESSTLTNALDFGLSAAIDKGILSKVFTGANHITARRVTRAITTAGVTIGITLGVAALLATPASPFILAATAAFAVFKIGFQLGKRFQKFKATQRNEQAFERSGLGETQRGRRGARSPVDLDTVSSTGGDRISNLVESEFAESSGSEQNRLKAGVSKGPVRRRSQSRRNSSKSPGKSKSKSDNKGD